MATFIKRNGQWAVQMSSNPRKAAVVAGPVNVDKKDGSKTKVLLVLEVEAGGAMGEGSVWTFAPIDTDQGCRCANCGRNGAKYSRTDSSGLRGLVCYTC
jgi:hypothetical protein